MRRFVLIAALAALAPTASARAEVEPTATNQAAERHFESGVNFYRNGDYESARIEFEAGYRLSRLPDFLVNLCQVADKQNRIQEAVNYCEQYLRVEPNAKDSAEVRTRLDRLRQQLGSPAQPASAPSQPSAPSTPAATPIQPATPAPARARPPAGALALLIGGGVLLAGGAGSGAGALVTAREIERGPAFDDLAGLQRRGEALNVAAITLYVAGGVAVAAGAGWLGYWGARRGGNRSPSPHRDSAP